jgi:hypothetical protein
MFWKHIIIGLFFLAATWMIDNLLSNVYEVLKANWGVEIPEATETKDLITT